MTDIILSGCMGKMGHCVAEIVNERDDCRIIAGVDVFGGDACFPVYKSFADVRETGDVIIDFSNASAVPVLIQYAVKTNTPVVLATTGLDDAQIKLVKQASGCVPVFYTANMSLGVSLVTELAKMAAKVLGSTYDIEIVEMHHRRKLDAPSGTALMIADSINGALEEKCVYEYNRHDRREKRPKNEIGIHAVRGGTIVGEHEVIFAGEDEVVKISHSAGSRRIFASGAVNAAVYLKGKRSGLYTMKDLVSE